MCGIAGHLNNNAAPASATLVTAMCDAIAHRGPDDSGTYIDSWVSLGSRRLSIIDLAGGHQPISNETETIWIVFNGEIYNFPELRQTLMKQGHILKTHTDTEVVVHLYEEYGTECLRYLNGMFAFAIWDSEHQRLFMARDRMGEKPLVYAFTSDGFTFASEIQAVLQDRNVSREVDLQALDLYLRYLYIPAPWTIFRSVRKLPPAHYLIIESGQARIEKYWRVEFGPKLAITEDQAAEQVRNLLADSVRRRLISDVPIGAFLSGGIDSSTIVALMSQESAGPVRTFSVGFEDNDFQNDELLYARQIAERYDTHHTELWVRPQMADVLPKLVCHYGEPFGDASAIPTYYISQAARQSVKVVLAGDGGDELFSGYAWYAEFAAFDPLMQARHSLSDGLLRSHAYLRNGQLRHAAGALKGIPAWWLQLAAMSRNSLRRLEQITSYYFSGELRREVYTAEVWRLVSKFQPNQPYRDHLAGRNVSHWDGLDVAFCLDHEMYLPDDILAKVDIASMACSLETRPPFLDYRLVELAASLPASFKLRQGETKHLLRKAVSDLLPATILERQKVGFGPPTDRWLRNSLYTMAADLFHSSAFQQRGYFDSAKVIQMLDDHQTGRRDFGNHLYLILNFEMWARMVLNSSTT